MRTQQAVHLAIAATVIAGPILAVESDQNGSSGSDSLRITSVVVTDQEATVFWDGGNPSFQLQSRPNLGGPWENEGAPTLEHSLTVPIRGDAAFFRVVQDFEAKYEITFDATWSAATHPGAWPANVGHWSAPIGGLHNDQVKFWEEGGIASAGIERMAERGSPTQLQTEIEAEIPNGNALFTFSASGFNSPGRRVLTFPRATTRDYSLVTLCSMIAPSPDWFVGVTGLNLIENGEWIQEKVLTLYGYDAGSDNGLDFTSPDIEAEPRGVITQFAGYPALIHGEIVPIGYVYIPPDTVDVAARTSRWSREGL